MTIGKGKIKMTRIDLDREQGIIVKCGDMHLYIVKDYPNSTEPAVKRQYERRKALGLCSYFGCTNKPLKPYQKCRHHLDLDNFRRQGMKVKKRSKK
jgi:hypothetical protein